LLIKAVEKFRGLKAEGSLDSFLEMLLTLLLGPATFI